MCWLILDTTGLLLSSTSSGFVSSSSSIILMSLIEGLWLLLHPSGMWGIRVLVSKRGPVRVMTIAPVGAVRIMERTQIMRILEA